MGVRERARIDAARHEPGEMRHIDHERGADGIGNLAKAREIDDARIGRTARDDHFGLCLMGEPLDLVEIDPLIVAPNTVGHGLEPLARIIDRGAMGEMSASRTVHAHERVARLHERHEHSLVRLRARMRLDIGEAAIEKPPGALDGERLDLVDESAAAVIAPARIAFGIFVGEDRALRLEHRGRDDVLGCDELDLPLLAPELTHERAQELRIPFGKRRPEERRCATLRRRGDGLRHSTGSTALQCTYRRAIAFAVGGCRRHAVTSECLQIKARIPQRQ